MHSYLHGHPALIDAVKRLEHLGPDKFELYFLRRESQSIEVKDQKVESLTRAEDVGLSIRVLKEGRLGFSYTTSLDRRAIEKAAESALEITQVMPKDEFSNLYSFGSVIYPSVDTWDARGLQVTLPEKIDQARRLEATCRGIDKRITGIRKAALGETRFEVHMVDSSGEHIQHSATQFSATLTCKAEQGGEGQVGHDFSFHPELESLDVDGVARRAATLAVEQLGATQPPTLRCPAVFRNDAVASLLEFISASFSAEEMSKGRSLLAGRQGERVFSERVTLVDDGLLPNGYSTAPFDGEGHPSGRTVLVDGGTLSGALYDAYYARKLGAEPTGSSVRAIKTPPSIGISNFYLERGRKTYEQLVADLDRGVVITDLMALHTANPVTGDFSLGAVGFLVEKGHVTRPIRGFAVAGNVLELFRKMTDIGDDLRFFGNVGAPSVRVSDLAVSGS